MRAWKQSLFAMAMALGGCGEDGASAEDTALLCSDTIDNDGDSAVDCDDSDCQAIAAACSGGGSESEAEAEAEAEGEAVACPDAPGEPGAYVRTLKSGGLDRTFRLFVPDGVDPGVPAPLVLNFHGRGSNAQQQEFYSAMIAKADQAGFITVAGEGIGASWNGGPGCCAPANEKDIDDVQFARDLVAAVAASYCVDPRRVYSTGMSNGGYLSNRLACDAADVIAAVAPVAATLGVVACEPSRAVPIMMFNGTEDTLVSYAWAVQSFDAWRETDGCDGEPEVTFQMGDSTCESTLACADGAQVTLCTVEGGGHTWPGAAIPLPALGATTSDLDATDAMWEFFAAHPMPGE